MCGEEGEGVGRVSSERVSVHAHAACNELSKWTSAVALVPSAGLTSRHPMPVACESRFKTSPAAVDLFLEPVVERAHL